MKRFNSLLQRKHDEFGRGHDSQRTSNISNSQDIVRGIGLHSRDGYDWLRQIKRGQPSRVQARPVL